MPGGTEDVTTLKRATVETLAIPLKISAPSLKISSEWNLWTQGMESLSLPARV